MSSVKKVLQQREAERILALAAELEDEQVLEPANGGGGQLNAFGLLLDDSDSEPAQEEEEEVASSVEPVVEEPTHKGGKKKKKKSKKKKKKKNGKGGSANVNAAIDEHLAAMSMASSPSATGSTSGAPKTSSSTYSKKEQKQLAACFAPVTAVLCTKATHFNPDVELKNKFGSVALRAAQSEEQEEMNHNNRRRRQHGRGTALRQKKMILSRLGDELPDRHVGLGAFRMKLLEVRPQGNLFQFDMENQQAVDRQYEAATSTHDPQRLAYFLEANPFHVQALLQMSQIYLHHGEAQASVSLLQRCLFVYERSLHPEFKLLSGTCRLDYAHRPNQAFFRSLARYARYLGKKGCPRTALEFHKLLLSLSLDDPQCALITIDYYCLRSRQHSYLLDLLRALDAEDVVAVPCRMMVNFAFSSALAAFRMEKDEMKANSPPSSDAKDTVGSSGPESKVGTGPLADVIDLQLPCRQDASATQRLQWALLMFPEVLQPLVQASRPKDSAGAGWVTLYSHPHFRLGQDRIATQPYIARMVKMFVERNAGLWKTDRVTEWLQTTAQELVVQLDELAVASQGTDQDAADVPLLPFLTAHRKVYGQTMPEKYRHLAAWEYSDAPVPAVPEDLLANAEVQPADPFQQLYGHMNMQGGNPLMVFLRTLLPWAGGQPDALHAVDDEDDDME